jgi:hypothetical protein
MSTKQLKNWSIWWDGLRTAMIKAGATSITTNLSVLASTNTISNMGIPGFTHIGEDKKTFLVALLVQFIVHTAYAAAMYLQNNPDAPVTTVTEDTTFIAKSATGNTVTQSSSTVTTTPITNEKVKAPVPPTIGSTTIG